MPTKGPRPRPLADRFWSKVDRRGPDECWPWTASTSKGGYGQISSDDPAKRRAPLRSNRVVWELLVGPIPDGLLVLHRCDSPPCCNPAHLFLGTHADNSAAQKGRARTTVRVGESNPGARLTLSQVASIRGSGARADDLAAEFGVHPHTIRDIRAGRTWKAPTDV